ncbi:hypothetical protein [Streptomyces purpurascens]|uniref:Integral membrane protein n=1 Tax=Streptomyces purpurascens TaxID=1924 RepID=A0ABZ1MQA8_STREF|nr:hypothetical protein [Streptomyces purpurascens]MCE7045358.1 hypothetical protein [Streptomyces purpurascens]GHA05851.1 hypothetical protein GCM10010303_14300 [Streptomyces purpurascens]
MRTGKGDISGWLGRLVSGSLWVGSVGVRALVAVALLVCLLSWPAVGLQAGLSAGTSAGIAVLRACRRPRGGGSVLRWGAAVVVDVLLSSVFPFVRPVRRRTLRRAVTLCAGLCVCVFDRRR